MDALIQALNALASDLESLKAKVADAQVAAQANYDKGFADGVASVQNGDKIYSQAELDAKIAEAVSPLNDRISSLEAEIAGIPAKIDEAVSAAKVELRAKFKQALQEQQAAESAGEQSLADLIDSL